MSDLWDDYLYEQLEAEYQAALRDMDYGELPHPEEVAAEAFYTALNDFLYDVRWMFLKDMVKEVEGWNEIRREDEEPAPDRWDR